ncbi:UNVERIFIED_CONTAM: hypothetical protein FKN15_027149 [Acipenser sinensis]
MSQAPRCYVRRMHRAPRAQSAPCVPSTEALFTARHRNTECHAHRVHRALRRYMPKLRERHPAVTQLRGSKLSPSGGTVLSLKV